MGFTLRAIWDRWLARVAERLQAVVREMRGWTRLGQASFAAAAGIAKNTIGRLETGQARSAETATLKLIAETAVREAAGRESGRHNVDQAYRRLLVASGHLPEANSAVAPPEPPRDPLLDHIEAAFGDDAGLIEDFLEQAKDFRSEDRLWILQTVQWLLKRADALRRIPPDDAWHPRRSPSLSMAAPGVPKR